MDGVGRQVRALARRDLTVEARTGEILWLTAPFAGVALLLVALAVGANVTLLREIAAGLYWALVLVFGALVALRQSGVEPPPHGDVVTLLGVEPEARFVARAGTSTLLLIAFQALLAPLAIVLYDPAAGAWLWLVALVPLVAVGIGALGTLAAALTANVGARAVLVPLLVLPLGVPLVLGATQVLEAATHAQGGLVPWLGLIVLVDLVIVAVGLGSARWLAEEVSR
jgi:heme exporter protein B